MSDESNVVSLTGAPVPGVNGPLPDVVDLLRKMLARAEAGEVRGIVLGVVGPTTLYTGWAREQSSAVKYQLLAVGTMVQSRLVAALESEAE